MQWSQSPGRGIIPKEQFSFLAAPRTKAILKIQSKILGAARSFLTACGFTEMLPVMLADETDPLCHEVFDAKIPYCGKEYHLTKSMILQKQIAASYLDKIFIFSPNIRLEQACKRETGRHLIEFVQLDLEMQGAKRETVLELGEKLLSGIISEVKTQCKDELALLKREIAIPHTPFKKIRYEDALKKFGEDFEKIISQTEKEPVWLVDIPITKREFYDKEDPAQPGFLLDMDLIYPEGYCEALSGGEREFEYERIVGRIKKSGKDPAHFKTHVGLAKEGKIPPSAGFGIGIERLTRYICGLEHIADARMFAKLPGGDLVI